MSVFVTQHICDLIHNYITCIVFTRTLNPWWRLKEVATFPSLTSLIFTKYLMTHVVHWQSICINLLVNLSYSNKVIYSTLVLGQTCVCVFPALYPYLLHSISRCCPGMTCYVLAYHLRSSVTSAQRKMSWDRKPKHILHPVWVWSVLYWADRWTVETTVQ